MVNSVDIIIGIFTVAPLIIGFSMGFITLRLHYKKKSALMLLSSILFFSLPSPWIGSTLLFLGEIMGIAISDRFYVFSYAWSVPVFATTWCYITASFNKSKPKLKYIILLIFIILDIIYFYSVYILEDYDVVVLDNTIFKDSTFTGSASIISTIMALSVLFYVSPTYFNFAINSTNSLVKYKSKNIAVGAILFIFGAIIDGIYGVQNYIGLIFIRMLIMISLYLLYLGYITPQRIRERLRN